MPAYPGVVLSRKKASLLAAKIKRALRPYCSAIHQAGAFRHRTRRPSQLHDVVLVVTPKPGQRGTIAVTLARLSDPGKEVHCDHSHRWRMTIQSIPIDVLFNETN